MTQLGLPEAEETSETRVGWFRVFVGLLVVGVAVAAVWVVIAWGVSTLNHASGADCSTEPVESVESLFGVDLPDGTTMAECRFQDADALLFTATFTIPGSEFALPAEWAETRPDADGVLRTAEYETVGDSTTLVLTMSSD